MGVWQEMRLQMKKKVIVAALFLIGGLYLLNLSSFLTGVSTHSQTHTHDEQEGFFSAILIIQPF